MKLTTQMSSVIKRAGIVSRRVTIIPYISTARTIRQNQYTSPNGEENYRRHSFFHSSLIPYCMNKINSPHLITRYPQVGVINTCASKQGCDNWRNGLYYSSNGLQRRVLCTSLRNIRRCSPLVRTLVRKDWGFCVHHQQRPFSSQTENTTASCRSFSNECPRSDYTLVNGGPDLKVRSACKNVLLVSRNKQGRFIRVNLSGSRSSHTAFQGERRVVGGII
mgnify:CR=1 FL=1